MSDDAAKLQQLLLLVWVHGFVGDESTFGGFPEDVCEAAQKRFTTHDVHSIFYPTYRTVGELDVATTAFVKWLYQCVQDLEQSQAGKTNQEVHTTVILLGHSMGGMLVADAAKAVHDETKKEPGKHIADVRGVIAIDTPFLGIHPALVSYGMEQIDAYIDKTLLGTATTLENSPKFLKSSMAKIGITPNKLHPSASGSVNGEPSPGRLTNGLTSVLGLPGKVSSAEWDWTREAREGGWEGLKRAVSGETPNEEEVLRREEERKVKKEEKEKEREEKRVKKDEERRVKKEEKEKEKREKKERGEEEKRVKKEEKEKEEREKRERKEEEKRVEEEKKRLEEEEKERERREKLSEEEREELEKKDKEEAEKKKAEDEKKKKAEDEEEKKEAEAEAKVEKVTERTTEEATDKEVQNDSKDDKGSSGTSSKGDSDKLSVPPTLPPRRSSGSTTSKDVVPEQALSSSPSNGETISETSNKPTSAIEIPTATSNNISSPKLASSVNSAASSHTTSTRPSTDSATAPPIVSVTSSSEDHTITDPKDLTDQSTAAKQAQQKKNWKWVRSHMQFMSSCWSVGEISRRMKGIDKMQKEGMYFVNLYTIVKPSPPLHPKDRTFVALPTSKHPTKDSWKPFIHDSASDQVEAHMALFDKEKHKGYGRLIVVIEDEIEEVLKRVENC